MATLEPRSEVAEGIYRCGSDRVNWYLVEVEDRLLVVDAGYPAHWNQLGERLAALGRDASDIAACLLTHAHPDHIGFAQRLHDRANVPVWLHEAGIQRARDGGDPPLGGFVTNLWRPAVLRYFVEAVRSDGTAVPPVTDVEPFADGDELPVPGRPRVTHVPGHTEDEVAFSFPDRGVLFCGDALATVDFETWEGHAPRLLPAWLNRDHERARESIDRLESFGEIVLLPGHGEPWTGDAADAVASARER